MLIAIDHGNKQMKTVNCPPFVSGLAESSTKPFGSNILKYRDRYYTLSNQRIPYKRDKTEDDRFFILTLFGIAQELQAKGMYGESPQRIRLAVGLPPAHYGAQHQAFIRYFFDRGVVKFNYRGKNHAVYIEDVRCYPQAYAAAVNMMDRLVESPKVLIVDIGGFTADYLMMRFGAVKKHGGTYLSLCASRSSSAKIKLLMISSRWRYCVGGRFAILESRTEGSLAFTSPRSR